MSNCIYCRFELPAVVPKEHVIPQNFGNFKPDLTLTCVCKECNHYFGSKLEWPMLRQSVEGMRRLQFGFRGKVGGIHTSGLEPVLGEGDINAGARTELRTDDKGIENTIILPQVGGRHSKDNAFEWCLEQDLTVEWASKFPKGSEFHIIGGENDADSERLMKKWLSVCPTFQYGGQLERPSTEDGRVMIHVDHQHNPTTIRCLCKFAFNYMALIKGPDFALSPSFDSLRAFIRYDQGGAEGKMIIKQKPIIAQEIVRAERWTDGHILTIEGRPKDRIVEGQVALFNSIPYQIPLCRDYRGEWFAKGHHFHTEDWTASELRVEIAGEGFDPASLA
jgi:HNH endonuclease